MNEEQADGPPDDWDDFEQWRRDDELEEELLRWKFVPLLYVNRELKAALLEHAARLASEGVIDAELDWRAFRAVAVTESTACHNGVGVLGLKHRRLVALAQRGGQPALLVAEQVFFEWDRTGTPRFWLIAPARHELARAVAIGPSLGPVGVPP